MLNVIGHTLEIEESGVVTLTRKQVVRNVCLCTYLLHTKGSPHLRLSNYADKYTLVFGRKIIEMSSIWRAQS